MFLHIIKMYILCIHFSLLPTSTVLLTVPLPRTYIKSRLRRMSNSLSKETSRWFRKRRIRIRTLFKRQISLFLFTKYLFVSTRKYEEIALSVLLHYIEEFSCQKTSFNYRVAVLFHPAIYIKRLLQLVSHCLEQTSTSSRKRRKRTPLQAT
jgi:hypothetical protein